MTDNNLVFLNKEGQERFLAYLSGLGGRPVNYKPGTNDRIDTIDEAFRKWEELAQTHPLSAQDEVCATCTYWDPHGASGDRGHCSWLSEKTFATEHRCADDHWTTKEQE